MTTETLITKKITYTNQELADLVAKTNGIVYTGEPHVVFRDDDTCVFEFLKEQSEPVPDKDSWILWNATSEDCFPDEIHADTRLDIILRCDLHKAGAGFDTTRAAAVTWAECGGGTISKYRIHKEKSEPVADKDGWIEWEAGELNIAPKELNPYDSVEYKLKDTSRGIGRNLVRDLFWCKGEGSTIICYKKV